MRLLSTSLLVGCLAPEPEEGSCSPGGEGELELVLDGIPSAVVLYAEGEEVARISESGTLTLPSGTYTAEVWRGEPGSGLVGDLWVADVPITSVCVPQDGRETLTVTGSAQRGHLWVSSGESLGAFLPEQLEAGGAQETDVRLDVGLVNDFRGFAFDRMGHLWAAASPTYGTRLMLFTPEQLSGRGEVAPALELTTPSFADFASISDLVLDEDGTLWLRLTAGDQSFDGLLGFSRQTLAEVLLGGESAEVEPDWVRPVDGLTGPVDLELGPDGALWLSFFDENEYLRIDDPRDGGTGVDAELTVWIQTPSMGEPQALAGPENLAFDDEGDAVALFWVSNALVEVPGGELGGEGALDVHVESDDLFVDQLPTGLVIDASGQAWLGNYAGDGTGQILSWAPGEQPQIELVSEELPAPTDLVLDPKPR